MPYSLYLHVMSQALRLSQLQDRINRALAINFPEPVWVQAEVGQVRESRGHIFLQFLESAEGQDQPLARIDAVLWKQQKRALSPELKKELANLLVEGHTLQCLVQVDYHPVYGLKLQVQDIDLEYALGRHALERQRMIEELTRSGLMERNRQHPLPVALQKIAVISSPAAAGWGDLQNQLLENSWDFNFQVTLFPAAMQGGDLETEVCQQLAAIAAQSDLFDLTVIIRGGGSKLDLAWFDSAAIATEIARHPLPVWTGIGHEIDQTITDLAAHTSLKTPTAVAAHLIDHNIQFLGWLNELGQQIRQQSQWIHQQATRQLEQLIPALQQAVTYQLDREQWRIDLVVQQLQQSSRQGVQNHRNTLDVLQNQLEALDPQRILQRGFSITLHKGEPILQPAELPLGTQLTTTLQNGQLTSTLTSYDDNE